MTNRESKILCDTVDPKQVITYALVYACEDCVHFQDTVAKCSIGYQALNHIQSVQNKRLREESTLAFCRFLEID